MMKFVVLESVYSMELVSMKAIGVTNKGMVLESSLLRMEMFMMGTGFMRTFQAREQCGTQMETSM